MKQLVFVSLAVAACSSSPKPPPSTPGSTASTVVDSAPPATTPSPAPAPTAIVLTEDTPEKTATGNTFVAPGGWTLDHKGSATIMTAPEPGSTIAIVDVDAADSDAAVATAWQTVRNAPPPWRLLQAIESADKDGWSKIKTYAYDVPPNAKRLVVANAAYANGGWLVLIADLDQAVAEKRGGQISVIASKLLPKGHERESFAGKQAHDLDAPRLAALAKFLSDAASAMRVPGVGYGIVQHGKVVFAGGVGVRELGKPAKVDGDTEFMIASNTKQLTTLMLAKLVDSGKLSWDTPVTQLLPSFRLGSDEVTRQVLVKHLICACTGLPRQDYEMILNFKQLTPTTAIQLLGTMQPTSKFGEMFQYSNLMAAAGGFVGGHAMFPKLELGAAYDKAMQTLVFDPLGMKATTFDYARARRGNHAEPFSLDVEGAIQPGPMAMNYSVAPVRPAGAAWSTVNDMLKYVAMELADGKLPSGATYLADGPLRAREAPQVAVGKNETYGMGLMVNNKYGVTVIHHGGDVFGYHSDVMWLPDSDVGAVILTNGDGGGAVREGFRRKLLELLFDGTPEADAGIAAASKALVSSIEVSRKLLVIPADPAVAGKLAAKYSNAALGTIVVTRKDGKLWFQIGPLASEMATKANDDGTVSFVTLAPGFMGFDLTASGDNLVLRDAQHEYVYTPSK
jgi:CubicO group peptidase (beta-lactamase class C family)